MADLSTPVVQGQSVGIFALGASLHDILTRTKSQSSTFPKIDIIFSRDHPLNTPIAVRLPVNAITLRFDAREQRLRYIEVADFTRMRFTYKGHDMVRLNESDYESTRDPPSRGPAFRTIYKLFGPTTPGEYFHPTPLSPDPCRGKYCLSYPGISFMFPMEHRSWSQDASWSTIVSVLSSSATLPASSMCVFHGESWQKARGTIYSAELPFPRTPASVKNKDHIPKEIEYVKVCGEGRLEFVRHDAPSFWVVFGETTPQDLVTELGPPDTIYRNARKQSIHWGRANSQPASRRPSENNAVRPSSLSGETEFSSQTDTSDEEDDLDVEEQESLDDEQQVWYNYFHHGIDVLIGNATSISLSPSRMHQKDNSHRRGDANSDNLLGVDDLQAPSSSQPSARNHPTAIKVMLHGNIPGSWQFNRHRRIRWTLDHAVSEDWDGIINSETPFPDISARLKDALKFAYGSEEDEKTLQQPMALNRGWGNGESLTGSVELLGEWEESGSSRRKRKGDESDGGGGLGGAELYGFPGLIFEVLRNGAVSDLLVY